MDDEIERRDTLKVVRIMKEPSVFVAQSTATEETNVTDPNVFSQLQIGHQLDIPLTPVHFLTPLRTQICV